MTSNAKKKEPRGTTAKPRRKALARSIMPDTNAAPPAVVAVISAFSGATEQRSNGDTFETPACDTDDASRIDEIADDKLVREVGVEPVIEEPARLPAQTPRHPAIVTPTHNEGSIGHHLFEAASHLIEAGRLLGLLIWVVANRRLA